jgi:regulator of replication initiation timing
MTLGGIAAGLTTGLGINQLWTRKRTAGQVANEFAQAAATILRPLEASISRLNNRVAVVERENHSLTLDNNRLRVRVDVLEKQLHSLGVTPAPEPQTKGQTAA